MTYWARYTALASCFVASCVKSDLAFLYLSFHRPGMMADWSRPALRSKWKRRMAMAARRQVAKNPNPLYEIQKQPVVCPAISVDVSLQTGHQQDHYSGRRLRASLGLNVGYLAVDDVFALNHLYLQKALRIQLLTLPSPNLYWQIY